MAIIAMLYKNNSILYIGYTPYISFYTTLFTDVVTPENFDDIVNSIKGTEFKKNSEISFLGVLTEYKAYEYGLK